MEPGLYAGRTLTIDEFERLPEDTVYRTELVRGKLVCEPKPAYRHGRLQSRIAFLLERYIDDNKLEFECVTEIDFRLAEHGSVCSPDVALIRRARVEANPPVTSFHGTPDLAVEIISPSNSAEDLRTKVIDYFAAGTAMVWVVYPISKTVAVFRTAEEARYLMGQAELDGGNLMPGFGTTVAALFARL